MFRLDLEVSEVLIWTFTLFVTGQFFSFLTGTHNIAIIGVCLTQMFILLLHSTISVFSLASTQDENKTKNNEKTRKILAQIISGLSLVLVLLLLASTEILVSLGIVLFSFRPFLASLTISFFVIQVLSIFTIQNHFFSNKKEPSDSSKNNEKPQEKILPLFVFFSSACLLMICSVVIVIFLTFIDIPAIQADLLIKLLHFPLFYLPLALLYLFITDRVTIGGLSK